MPDTAAMRLFRLPFLAGPLCTLAFAAGCGASTDAAIATGESNYTSEGGAEGGDGGAADASGTNAPVEVAPFSIDEVASTPELRFSYDGAPPVDALQTAWETVISHADRRFKLQGATPVLGGKPVFFMEFGRGQAFIEKGTYDCAQMEAIVGIIGTDGAKELTLVAGASQRACKVIIDEAVDVDVTTGVRPRSFRKVVGRVEAEVGPRADGAAPAKILRAAFAASVIESGT